MNSVSARAASSQPAPGGRGARRCAAGTVRLAAAADQAGGLVFTVSDTGPGLVFVTLPNIFASMPGGRLWGTLFFVFMSFAALSTVIAVFENIISYCVDTWLWTRRRAAWVNGILLYLLSLPCVFGFNLLSGFQPLGPGSTVLDLEDFLVSANLLPFGILLFIFFCTRRQGWGWEAFVREADQGKGLPFPVGLRAYLSWVVPAVVLLVFVQGYVERFTR